MKFLLDHDVPDDLSYLLEQLGHDVRSSEMGAVWASKGAALNVIANRIVVKKATMRSPSSRRTVLILGWRLGVKAKPMRP